MKTTMRKARGPARFSESWIKQVSVPPGQDEAPYYERGTGLGLRVRLTGVKTFVLTIRLRDKRRWREKLGQWPGLSLEAARKAAQVRIGEIAAGLDPFAQREADRAKLQAKATRQAEKKAVDKFTLRRMIHRWDQERLTERRKSYALLAVACLKRTFGDFLDVPVVEITRRDVRAALDRAKQERGPGAAASAGAFTRTLFNWAARQDLIERNIMRDFEVPLQAEPPERILSEAEVRRMFTAGESMGYPHGCFAQLLALTGQRRTEIAHLEWGEIVQEPTGDWAIDLPPERVKTGRKTGGHRVHLSPAALKVLEACPRHLGCPFVFTTDGVKRYSAVVRSKERLDAALAADGGPPVEKWTWHDLRGSMVTSLAARGHSEAALDCVIGHKPSRRGKVAGIYQKYMYEPERRAALHAWGEIISGPEPAAPVGLPFLRKTA